MDEHEVVIPTMLLTFHPDTLEVDIDAPDMPLDFAISLLERAKKLLESQEKMIFAQQASAAIQAARENIHRTSAVMSKIKLQ